MRQMSPAGEEYWHLTREMVALIDTGLEDDEEATELWKRVDAPWCAMTAEDRRLMRERVNRAYDRFFDERPDHA